MRFGPVPLEDAEGAILAHAANVGDGRIAKGTRLAAADVARLRAHGLVAVTGAVLDHGDLPENEAAARIGERLLGLHVVSEPAATGRVNLFAGAAGVFVVDRAAVDRLNAIDPAITLATLPEFAPVRAGQMVATVKIIPLAVSGASVADACAVAAGAFHVAAFRPRRIALVQTRLPAMKESVLDKTRRVLETRLQPTGSKIAQELRCRHATEDLSRTLDSLPDVDLVIVFGASAVIDADDVIPAAIRASEGRILQLGMPVDPGNLILLGSLGDKPILGAPGCARSPKENGFDWILNRLLADIEVLPEHMRRMGVGGLLTEIPSRPQPRRKSPP